ncbi:MAG: thioesterase family protein [bacterium]|nr:thioesterase family protein [bacterium]
MSKSAKTCTVRLKVPFHDVDPIQVVWHGHYFKYFELARTEIFDQIGLDLHNFYLDSGYVFPISRTIVKYIHPLRYKDEFTCTATIAECKRKIIINYEIRLVSNNLLCTKGSSEQVAVKYPEMEMELVIPEEIQKALKGPA